MGNVRPKRGVCGQRRHPAGARGRHGRGDRDVPAIACSTDDRSVAGAAVVADDHLVRQDRVAWKLRTGPGESIIVPSGACPTIAANAVRLDCAGPGVTGISISEVSDVSVTNCTPITESIGSGQSFVIVTKSTNVTFTQNRLLSIVLTGGHNNRVLQNSIDGGYDGSGNLVGHDHGVFLVNESNATIQGNTRRNFYNAGIEGSEVVGDSLIADNTIDNAVVAGVAGFWCTSWTGNTIRDNHVSRSLHLVRFRHQVAVDRCRDPRPSCRA